MGRLKGGFECGLGRGRLEGEFSFLLPSRFQFLKPFFSSFVIDRH